MNLGEMLDQTLPRMGVETDTARVRRQHIAALNAEYRWIFGMRLWPFRLTNATVSFTSGQEYIDLAASGAADCSVPEGVILDAYGTPLSYTRKDITEFLHGAASYRGAGTPESWAVQGGYLWLDPRPSFDGTLTLWYYRQFTESGTPRVKLVEITDEPIFPNEFHQALPDGALVRLAAFDSYDPTLIVETRRARDRLLRAMNFTASKSAAPRVAHLPFMEGQF